MDAKGRFNTQKLMLAGLLISVGILGRIILHDFFNGIGNPFTTNGVLDVFFVIAAISIFSGILLGKYYTFIVPICVIAITDIFYAIVDPQTVIYWTSWLFLFTGSGYVFIALIGTYAKRKAPLNMAFVPKLLGAGILGIVTYDLWTNFGFWLAYSKLGFFPQTLEGLMLVILDGAPFMLWHLLSTSIIITIVAIPLVHFKEYKLLRQDHMPKPIEKYIVTSATLILITVSILTAIF